MTWVSILKRKPTQSGFYYWKGKNNYGGKEYYDCMELHELHKERFRNSKIQTVCGNSNRKNYSNT